MLKTTRTVTLSISIGLFAISLTQKCYCTDSSCGDSIAVVFVGALGVIMGGACLAWLANPALVTSWMFVKKKPTLSLIMSVAALLISLSFLLFDKIVDNEGGGSSKIISYRAGYWLWVSSAFVMFIGNLIMYFLRKNEKK
jgi:hypothetical protein